MHAQLCPAHVYTEEHITVGTPSEGVYPFIDRRASLRSFGLSGMSGMQSIVLIAQHLGPSPTFLLKGYVVTTPLT